MIGRVHPAKLKQRCQIDYDWHRYFVWWPLKIELTPTPTLKKYNPPYVWVWLSFIERRIRPGHFFTYDYRLGDSCSIPLCNQQEPEEK
jgi:hypothetical protein